MTMMLMIALVAAIGFYPAIVEGAQCRGRTNIDCPAGQRAITEDDLLIEHRERGDDEILRPTEKTKMNEADRIVLKYRPGGVTQLIERSECFRVRVKNVNKVNLKLTNNAGDELSLVAHPNSKKWRDVYFDLEDAPGHFQNFDDMRMDFEKEKSGKNMYIKNFDFSGCVDED